jgi:hypothetical protein
MGKPYSEGLRARVVRAAQDGVTIPETAEQLGVARSYASVGSTAKRAVSGRPNSAGTKDMLWRRTKNWSGN